MKNEEEVESRMNFSSLYNSSFLSYSLFQYKMSIRHPLRPIREARLLAFGKAWPLESPGQCRVLSAVREGR